MPFKVKYYDNGFHIVDVYSVSRDEFLIAYKNEFKWVKILYCEPY